MVCVGMNCLLSLKFWLLMLFIGVLVSIFMFSFFSWWCVFSESIFGNEDSMCGLVLISCILVLVGLMWWNLLCSVWCVILVRVLVSLILVGLLLMMVKFSYVVFFVGFGLVLVCLNVSSSLWCSVMVLFSVFRLGVLLVY